MKRLIVAITGASGAVYGVRLLQMLRSLPDVQTHLVLSQAGGLTAAQELGLSRADIEALADVVHNPRDVGATVASGSFTTHGMVIAPCSMKTLASVALGLGDNLVSRAADVVLKERRRLVLLARETPLNLAHLRNMATVTEMGGVICPPVPAFYSRPQTLDDVVNHSCARVLDLFDLDAPGGLRRWDGLGRAFEPFIDPTTTTETP